MADSWQDLVHLEQDFFDAGYKDGYEHGRIHGLIEGRALGCEKGYEMWEEVGFYEGFALTWKDAYEHKPFNESDTGSKQTFQLSPKLLLHLRHLLKLISQFPKVNPKSSSTLANVAVSSDATSTPESEVDVLTLLNNIRARYKALCASLGVRGRVIGWSEADVGMSTGGEPVEQDDQTRAVKRLKQPIWQVGVSKAVDIHDEDPNETSSEKVVPGSAIHEMNL